MISSNAEIMDKLQAKGEAVMRELEREGLDALVREDCRGHRREVSSCPVARLLRKRTGARWLVGATIALPADWAANNRVAVWIPEQVANLIHEFDEGQHPELER